MISSSLPNWAEYIQERINYHQNHRFIAKELDDWDSADQHQVIADELIEILEAFGITAQ